MSGPATKRSVEERLWLLIVLTLACALLYLPLGLASGIASALYAHLKGKFAVRNVLLLMVFVPVLILAILQP